MWKSLACGILILMSVLIVEIFGSDGLPSLDMAVESLHSSEAKASVLFCWYQKSKGRRGRCFSKQGTY